MKDRKLAKRWRFDSNDEDNKGYAGQGNHNLSVTDVDGDGKDEIIYGQMTIDDNGKGLYTTGIGHVSCQQQATSRMGKRNQNVNRFDDAYGKDR